MKENIKRKIDGRTIPLNKYISILSNIEQLEDNIYVKTKTGYISVLKIFGIDIFNYKQNDKSSAYVIV